MENTAKTMDKLVALCKNRGFIFAGSEIYGGLANTWDYGPLGVELKNNVKKAWWKKFVQENPYNVGQDAAILMNPQTWVASGHLSGFSDPLMDCRECKERFRADKLIEDFCAEKGITPEKPVDAMSQEEMVAFIDGNNIPCPTCGKHNFTDIRQFNLMFKTFQGVTEDAKNTVYLRPETAQGIFVNFVNVQRTTRRKLPFGIAQIGKSFRNEITPGNFIFRVREERPDLLAYNANTWFKQESSQRMLRTLDGSARAYLSNRYRRIDNIDIAGVTLPILGGLPDIRFESCQITESRMYIKAVTPRLQAEVSPGDIVQAGVIISNSEVGLGSVSIQPLIYRLVCSNGMVVNEAAARRNHVGRANDSEENFSVYSQATLDAEDKAFVMKIQDTVRAAVEEARFAQVVGKMQEAKAAQMDTHDVPAVVKLASKEFHITDSESTGVLQRLIESNNLTLYGLSNAVTRHSQDVESYDRASELESIGYSILTMPAQQWSRINRAAA